MPKGIIMPDRLSGVAGPLQEPCERTDQAFALSFFIRMLFSCLVDADFIATERFYARANGEGVERGWHGNLNALKQRLDSHMAELSAGKTGEVNAAAPSACSIPADVVLLIGLNLIRC